LYTNICAIFEIYKFFNKKKEGPKSLSFVD
jgi:hypothetical protein